MKANTLMSSSTSVDTATGDLVFADCGSIGTHQGASNMGSTAPHSAWRVGWASITGTRHTAQGVGCEDSLAARAHSTSELHIALADGVSQGARGEIASRALVQHCTAMPVDVSPAEWLQGAEPAVQAALTAVTDGRGAATLVAAWLGGDGGAILTRVGDCRVYRWGAGAIAGDVQVTQERPDQSFASLGESPPFGVDPHNPARMVGLGKMQGADAYELWHTQLEVGEGLILCSDGVHDVLDNLAMGQILQTTLAQSSLGASTEEDLMRAAQCMAAQAQWLGSDDDIAVMVVVRVKA